MNVSRLCSVSLVLGVAAGTTIIACGSSSKGTPDAKVFKDAGGSSIDAAGSGGGLTIGKSCTGGGSGDPSLCVAADPICTSLTGTAWFCSESCGTSACAPGGTPGTMSCEVGSNGSSQPTRPPGGNAICAMQKAASTGTPACALYGNGSGTGSAAINWDCAILCGMSGSNNLGTCPTGLTCTSNFCQ